MKNIDLDIDIAGYYILKGLLVKHKKIISSNVDNLIHICSNICSFVQNFLKKTLLKEKLNFLSCNTIEDPPPLPRKWKTEKAKSKRSYQANKHKLQTKK